MKTKETTLDQFTKVYPHPSAVLFRAIELRTIHKNTRNIDFSHPSLDLGCGDGKIASILFDDKFTYGVDNGEAKDVQEAIDNNLYDKVFLESAEKMSLPDNSVNFVFSNCVIEHIPNNEAVLSEVARILRPGGVFVFTVPSHNYTNFLYLSSKLASWGLGFLSKFYKYRRNKMLNQFHCHSKDDWNDKLNKHKLQIKKYQYYVSRESLMLWDRMALEIFIKKIFDKNAKKKVLNKYRKELDETYNKDRGISDDKGAGLFIYCVKK